MKKILILGLVAFLSLFLVYGFADAAVSGPCANCHTMHYSQGGGTLSSWGTAGPYSALLVNNCLGCHTTTGTDPLVGGYPYVRTSVAGGFTNNNCLAGGFFQPTANTADNNSDTDHDLGATASPAGFDAAENAWYTGATNGLGCAGTNGCHGNQTDLDDMAAIKGGHHAPSVYRILYVGANGVLGTGTADYEELLISGVGTAHNVYSATVGGPSISELCGKCHSNFHGSDDTGAASPFVRHPTDVAIPTTWDIYVNFATEWTADADAMRNHPLGFNAETETAANARVTCLSCHRSHGAQYNDILRWDYNATQVAGSGVTYGCLGCHNRQR
ncbi:MAG: cytochrome c3 family protein [Nitrospirota bacterium]